MDGPSFPEFFPQMQDFIQEKKKDSARTSAKKKKNLLLGRKLLLKEINKNTSNFQ